MIASLNDVSNFSCVIGTYKNSNGSWRGDTNLLNKIECITVPRSTAKQHLRARTAHFMHEIPVFHV